MTRVVLDSGALSKLAGVQQPALVCDESGRAVGYFEPLHPPTGQGPDGAEPPFSDEQIERFRQQRRGRSLTDILTELAGLP